MTVSPQRAFPNRRKISAFQRSSALLGAAALLGSAVLAQPALAATVLTYEAQELAVGESVTVSPLTTPAHCAVFLEWGTNDGLDVTVEPATGAVTVKVVAPQQGEHLVNVACGNIHGEEESLRYGGVSVTVVDDSTPPVDTPDVEDEDTEDVEDTDPVDTEDEKDKSSSLADLRGSSDLPRIFAGSSLR